jgi:broad specificity phosphatase PhoE
MWNRMQGHCDSPLTAQGIAQAEDARDALLNTKIDRIYTSTSGRTRKTAQIIAAPHGLEPIPLKGLKEVNFGDFDGVVRDSWVKEISERHINEHWSDVGGEDREDVRRRITDTLTSITARAKDGETILLVSHGTYYLNILETLFGMSRKSYFENAMKQGRQAMPNGGIFTFDSRDGEYFLTGLMCAPEDF